MDKGLSTTGDTLKGTWGLVCIYCNLQGIAQRRVLQGLIGWWCQRVGTQLSTSKPPSHWRQGGRRDKKMTPTPGYPKNNTPPPQSPMWFFLYIILVSPIWMVLHDWEPWSRGQIMRLGIRNCWILALINFLFGLGLLTSFQKMFTYLVVSALPLPIWDTLAQIPRGFDLLPFLLPSDGVVSTQLFSENQIPGVLNWASKYRGNQNRDPAVENSGPNLFVGQILNFGENLHSTEVRMDLHQYCLSCVCTSLFVKWG